MVSVNAGGRWSLRQRAARRPERVLDVCGSVDPVQRATRDHVELAADSPVCYNARQPGDPRHLAGQMGYETTGALPMIDLPLMLAFIAAASC